MGYSLASARTQATLSETLAEATAPASGEVALLSVSARTSSVAGAAGRRYTLERQSGGATPVAQTPELHNSLSAAAGAVGAVGYTTEPTVSGSPLVVLGYSRAAVPNVMFSRWVGHPRYPVTLSASEKIGLRGVSTSESIDYQRHITFGEPNNTPMRPCRGRRGRTRGYWALATTGKSGAVGVSGNANHWDTHTLVQAETWQMSPSQHPMPAVMLDLIGGAPPPTVYHRRLLLGVGR